MVVKDQKSNETLIGVTISFQNNTTTRTSLTNEYGFYSISLPKGEYKIVINSLSFSSCIMYFILNKYKGVGD